jgi:hypothetical protein
MFKQGKTLILMATIIAQASVALAQVSQSQTFKISVTLPAIIGLNISADSSSLSDLARKATTWPVVEQRVVRNKKAIMLRTVTMR